MTRPRPLALLAGALLACATAREGGTRSAGPAARGPSPGAQGSGLPVATPRGQRLFDQAVAATDEQRKAKSPDWALLEERWRTAAEDGGMAEAWYDLGVCEERLGKRAEAAAAYRQALAIAPEFREAAANLALLDEPKGARAAIAAWTEFLRRHPEDALARARLASGYQEAGQLDEAWRLSREALLRDPELVAALKVMLRVAVAKGNGDLASLVALRIRKLDPSDPEVPTAIGRILAKRGDEAAAEVQWRKAIALRSDYAPARAELLHVELAKRHWAGVADQAHALLRDGAGDARVELALGVAERYQGEADKAARSYDQAQQLAGDRLPEVHLARAILLAKVQERCEPALQELQLYARLAGPSALADGTVGALQRECEQILAAGRAAEEEARKMKAEAEKAARPKTDTGAAKHTQ